MTTPSREIRAVYTDQTIRVYQAYNNSIADAVLISQRFVDPWRVGRMTWIKPSAVWMGYRSGWASKDVNQNRILAIDLVREAFDHLLQIAVPARHQESESDVIIQWDPERALGGEFGREAMTHPINEARSIQIGLRGRATEWMTGADPFNLTIPLISSITDVTDQFVKIGRLLEHGDLYGAETLLPPERIYLPSTMVTHQPQP